jgi:hypothetical protein
MRKIIYIIIAVFLAATLFISLATSEINRQLKSVFLSTSLSIYNSFERELILSTYNSNNKMQYIKIKDLDYNISETNFDIDKSYVAFITGDKEYKIYVTLIGKGRYDKYSFENKQLKDLVVSNIKESKKTFNQNIKSINALEYKEA